ncbi:unnamed protein product, partial [Candidula unifasciata]
CLLFILGCVAGRPVFVRWIVLCLCLVVVTLILSHPFRDWLTSKTVIPSLYTVYKQEGALNHSPHNTNVNVRKFLDPNKTVPTKPRPSTCVFPQMIHGPSALNVPGMKKKAINCKETDLLDIMYITSDKTLKLNTSKLEEILQIRDLHNCTYRQIFRNGTDSISFINSQWSKLLIDFPDLAENAEFLQVECTNIFSGALSKTFHRKILEKEEFQKPGSLNFKKRQINSNINETLSVIMIGMDSLSRAHLFTAYNKAYSYLINSLKSFDLTMHSQVGGDKTSNFWPLFSGNPAVEVQNLCSNTSVNTNPDVVWRAYEDAGYRTVLIKSNPDGGIFHDLLKDCVKSSVRYNLRLLVFVMCSKTSARRSKQNSLCAENQLYTNNHLNCILHFLYAFPQQPVFVLMLLDQNLLNFYESLNQNGMLNRSLLVSFSDQGMRACRTPYTFLTFPEWFLKKYPDVAENLKLNTRRLTSHFDTHATLLDLLHISSDKPPLLVPLKHGISLFKKIPWNRTCSDADIPSDSCLSTLLVELVIEAINSKTDKNKCAIFKLRQVIRIQKFAIDENHSKGSRSTIVYNVKLKVQPGDALFEASVYEINQFNEWKVGGQIDRLNFYRRQSRCLDTQTNRPFCYCKNVGSEDVS